MMFVIGALALAAGCKNDDKRDADRAADKLAKKTGEHRDARYDFEAKRAERVTKLRAVEHVIAVQPQMITTLSNVFPVVERADLDDKLATFRLRVDDADKLIQGLQAAAPGDFKDRDDAASKAMDRLDDARKDAWKALKDAKRDERSSS
jgi:hypothetical protein